MIMRIIRGPGVEGMMMERVRGFAHILSIILSFPSNCKTE